LFGDVDSVPEWAKRYRNKCQGRSINGLSDGIDVANAVISAHFPPEAIEIDPSTCRFIGGMGAELRFASVLYA
jgi:hypothetical protein